MNNIKYIIFSVLLLANNNQLVAMNREKYPLIKKEEIIEITEIKNELVNIKEILETISSILKEKNYIEDSESQALNDAKDAWKNFSLTEKYLENNVDIKKAQENLSILREKISSLVSIVLEQSEKLEILENKIDLVPLVSKAFETEAKKIKRKIITEKYCCGCNMF